MFEVSHYIPIDFNHDSICGLPKSEWCNGTNEWEWVNCPACLERRPTQDIPDLVKTGVKDGPVRIQRIHGSSFRMIDPPSG